MHHYRVRVKLSKLWYKPYNEDVMCLLGKSELDDILNLFKRCGFAKLVCSK